MAENDDLDDINDETSSVPVKDLVMRLGLEAKILVSTKGSICLENFSEILAILKGDGIKVSYKTKSYIAGQLKAWTTVGGEACKKKIKENASEIFAIVEALAKQKEEPHNDRLACANTLCGILLTSTQFDATQKIAKDICPLAYSLIDVIKAECPQDDSYFELIGVLLRIMPYSGTVNVPNGFTVIYDIITSDKYPTAVKNHAMSAFNKLTTVAKSCILMAGNEIMSLIVNGDGAYDSLILTFLKAPEMYANTPEAIHNHLDKVFSLNYLHVANIIYNVSLREPVALVPYIKNLVEQLSEQVNMGPVTLLSIVGIAKASPDQVFPYLPTIQARAAFISNHATQLAQIFGACAFAKSPDNASVVAFDYLIVMLKESKEQVAIPAILAEISNVMSKLPSTDIISPHLPLIVSFKASSDVVVRSIEDFVEGRSLKDLTVRVDEFEAKLVALNTKVSESCKNFEEVKAYVDANISELKDFIGEVVKKLPCPYRLEVVGRFRKTFLLYFQCVQTGYEYPIETKDWSKWLKIGFSLIKAGKAVIDVGTGNPIGLLKTGIDCVSEIYEAYKSKEDADFNTYITHPFLTSTEQDGLIVKLRDQGFFEKFAYDAQAGGWYLINPTRDGKPVQTAATAGTVTELKSKDGYGLDIQEVTKAIVNVAQADGIDTGNLVSKIEINGVELIENVASKVRKVPEAIKEDHTISPIHANQDRRLTPAPGQADQRLQQRVEALEKSVSVLSQQLQSLLDEQERSRKNGCCCTVM